MRKRLLLALAGILTITSLGVTACSNKETDTDNKETGNKETNANVSESTQSETGSGFSLDGSETLFDTDEITDITLDGKYGSFTITSYDGESFALSGAGDDSLVNYELKKGRLTISVSSDDIETDGEGGVKAVLYIPRTSIIGDLNIKVDAGTVDISNFLTNTMEVEVGAGTVTVDSVRSGDDSFTVDAGELNITNADISGLDVDVALGKFSLQGYVAHDMDIKCDVGQCDMQLTNDSIYYNYDVTLDLGTVDIGTKSYTGTVKNEKVDNDSLYDITVKCGVGKVNIGFAG